MSKSQGEETIALLLRDMGIEYEREVRFAAPRRWRFDFAINSKRLAIEFDGGTWNGGRHVRGKGATGDRDKGNAAIIMGWRVLHFTADHLKDPQAIRNTILAAMK